MSRTGAEERTTSIYATLDFRKAAVAKPEETNRRAAREFFPALQAAPGFRGFYVIAQEDGSKLAVALRASKSDAEAFQAASATWDRALDEPGHRSEGKNGGELIVQIAPHA